MLIKTKLISFEIGQNKVGDSATELKELANAYKSGKTISLEQWQKAGLPVSAKLMERAIDREEFNEKLAAVNEALRPLYTLSEKGRWEENFIAGLAWGGNDLLIAGSRNGTIKMIDVNKRETVFTLDLTNGGHLAPVAAVSVNSEKTLLASADSKGAVIITDLATKEVVGLLDSGLGVVEIAWSPRGDRLAVAGREYPNNILKIFKWDPAAKTLQFEREFHGTEHFSWSPSGQALALGRDKEIGLVDLRFNAKPQEETVTSWKEKIVSMEWSPDGQRIVVAGEEGKAALFAPRTKELKELEMDRYERFREWRVIIIFSFSWSGDSRTIYAADNDGQVTAYNAESGRIKEWVDRERGGYEGGARVKLSPNGKFLATSGIVKIEGQENQGTGIKIYSAEEWVG